MRLRSTLILLALLGLCSHYSDACGAKGKKGAKGDDANAATPAPPAGNNNKNPLGNAKQEPYDNSGYDAKSGTANSPDDLKCDFEGPCCWKNTKPPYDTMEWNKVSNIPPDAIQAGFGTSTAPSGNALAVATDKAAGSSDKAEFESCAIPCAGDNIKLTLKHWTTPGVKLQVCEVAKADPNTLLSCQDVPSASPGPDTVSLPPGSDIILTIVAMNLVNDAGNAAIIDDITVDYPPCGGSSPPASAASTTTVAGATPGPSTPAGTPAGPDERSKLCCGFDAGPCGWSKGAGPSSPKGTVNDFQKAGPERFKNPATGVPPSPDKAFFAAYMKPKESAYMESAAAMPDKTVIKFQEYKATQDVSLKACCDTEQGCTYDTGGKVEKTDFRQWYQGSIECPAGSKKVVFYSDNQGVNEGGVGIDNIEAYDSTGNKIC